MIDTVRFRVPLTEYREDIYKSLTCKILTLTPDGRELRSYNRFIAYEEINSQFENIYINTIGSFLYFEFSLHKMINRHKLGINYNHKNYSFTTDYCYFIRFINILNTTFHFDIRLNEIVPMRIDIGRNYKLISPLDVIDLFEVLYLQMGRVSKIKTNQFQTSCYYPSRNWVTKKLYSKSHELKNYCSKGKLDKNNQKVKDLFRELESNKCIRFETSIKKRKLEALNIGFFDYNMINILKEYFEAEEMQILKFQDYFNKDKKKVKLTLQEEYFIKNVLNFGYNLAKEKMINEYSRATFFRVQNNLKSKGIHLKSMTKNDLENIENDFIELPEIRFEVI